MWLHAIKYAKKKHEKPKHGDDLVCTIHVKMSDVATAIRALALRPQVCGARGQQKNKRCRWDFQHTYDIPHMGMGQNPGT